MRSPDGVVESDSGRTSQLLRNIEHALAAVVLRNKGMLDCMEETPPAAPVNQTVMVPELPKILPEAFAARIQRNCVGNAWDDGTS